MIRPQNDRYSINLLMAIAFIVLMAISIYMIYSLPTSLRLSDGYQSQFLDVYLVLATTFIVGVASMLMAFRYKKEIIVFRDKIIDTAQQQRDNAEQAGKTTISLDSVKSALESDNRKEALHNCLQSLCRQLEAGQGALYELVRDDQKRFLELRTGYALSIGESALIRFEFGEGLVGQVAATGQTLYVDDVPEGYITILSGLGSSSPRYVLLAPVKSGDQVTGVIEIASFTKTSEDQRRFIQEAANLIGEKLSTKA
jgi:transcriptional regulator with GAF, ATPase, and Fis domain